MDLKTILLAALQEPRGGHEWYSEASKLRKMAKKTFEVFKKELLQSGLVISKDVSGREKEFMFNPDKINDYQKMSALEKLIDETIVLDKKQLDPILTLDETQRQRLSIDSNIFQTFVAKLNNLYLLEKLMLVEINSGIHGDIAGYQAKDCIAKLNSHIALWFSVAHEMNSDYVARLYMALIQQTQTEIHANWESYTKPTKSKSRVKLSAKKRK